jgi:hypothetical protein
MAGAGAAAILTGGKTTLLGISKRANRYVRKLLIHGARSCVAHLDRSRGRLGGWLDALQTRMHMNKATVALAAKIARMAILTKPGASYDVDEVHNGATCSS